MPPLLTLFVFGPGRGESILLIVKSSNLQKVYVIDCYATQPFDSPDKNPIIAIQSTAFSWDDVEAICLTHAHEDHSLGLEPVANKTTSSKWVWPGGVRIESVIELLDKINIYKRSTKTENTPKKLFANSIRRLAKWSENKIPFNALSGRDLLKGDVNIRFLAPKDEIADTYQKTLLGKLAGILEEKDETLPNDFHNIPSAGMVIDTNTGVRVLLLGDMVNESWEPVLKDQTMIEILKERKADIVKLPHHCSKWAIWPELLDLICDPDKTKAVFTPFNLRTPPPHDEAIKLVSNYVAELWCTVELPRASSMWKPSAGNNDPEVNLLLRSSVDQPQKANLPPVDCMVKFDVDTLGCISCSPGKFAYQIK